MEKSEQLCRETEANVDMRGPSDRTVPTQRPTLTEVGHRVYKCESSHNGMSVTRVRVRVRVTREYVAGGGLRVLGGTVVGIYCCFILCFLFGDALAEQGAALST